MSESKSINQLLEADQKSVGAVGSPSDTFEATVDILEISEESKLLGELVCFSVKEGDGEVLVLGQITEVKTENRWHQEPSFKGIIKRHGFLPNLSNVADNRIAKINVQSSFQMPSGSVKNHGYVAHKLANSPSTGVPVKKVSNEIMNKLVEKHSNLVSLGTAYGTDVDVPFWFRHFGRPDQGGDGDAYHIGVFGRTGSGKTTTAANMILGYARNSEHMSILILDPQEQFYEDNNVLPEGKFEQKIKSHGMDYKKYKVPEKVVLPNDASLFSELLLDYDFIRKAFRLHTQEKRELMAESIQEYLTGRMNKPAFKIGSDPRELLNSMIARFQAEDRYTENVYAKGQYLNKLKDRINGMANGNIDSDANTKWNEICTFFQEKNGKVQLKDIVEKVVCKPKNVIVLNISGRNTAGHMESLQTRFIKIIEDAIKEKGAELYSKGNQANCLIVLDEAHRFINTYTYEEEIKKLTSSIIDAVRTTRKYGIGYMFITQTIESLHEEIRRQIRIFSFGYGLTSGSEFRKIKDIINDDAGAKFYRSFIDPSSNRKYPFMFYGPISPLSFTGAPLFLEMKGEISNFPE